MLEIEQPFVVDIAIEEDTSAGSVDIAESNNVVEALTATQPETAEQDTVSAYIYTVYLFSTRSEEVAEQVNRKFQGAGHDTQIFVSGTGAESRYRIAVSGFESKQTANNFSDSIVRKLGVTGTWIGRERR
jgi:hypothetical protein